MTAFLLNWLIVSAAVWLTAQLLPGMRVNSFGASIGIAAVFGILNWALGYLLFVVAGIGTLGIAWILAFITWWIIDAIMLKLTDGVMDSLEIDSFGVALFGAALIALFTSLGHWLVG